MRNVNELLERAWINACAAAEAEVSARRAEVQSAVHLLSGDDYLSDHAERARERSECRAAVAAGRCRGYFFRWREATEEVRRSRRDRVQLARCLLLRAWAHAIDAAIAFDVCETWTLREAELRLRGDAKEVSLYARHREYVEAQLQYRDGHARGYFFRGVEIMREVASERPR